MSSALVRWLLVPWRDRQLLLALVGSAAIPVFLVATADLWRGGAADVITEILVEDGPSSDRTVSVETNASFSRVPSDEADRAVSERLASLPGSPVVTRTMSTPRGRIGNGFDTPALTVPARLVNHDGAIETIDYVRHLPDEFEGAWISNWMAERFGLELGDTLVFYSDAEPEEPGAEVAPGGGAAAAILIVGVYETLWTEDETIPRSERGIDLGVFLDSLPPALVPRYLSPFQAPSFALVFVDDRAMADLGVTGTVRWSAPIATAPSTLDELTAAVGDIRSLERSLVRDETIRDALDAQAGVDPAAPVVLSTLSRTLAVVEDRVASLDRPLRSTQVAGAAIGLLVMVGASAFAVSRRRHEFALLAAEGDRWEHFAARALGQLAMPTAVGAAIGFTGAALAGATLGPSAGVLDIETAARSLTIDRSLLVLAGGWLASASVTGVLGARALDRPGLSVPSLGRRLGLLGAGIALASYVWIDAGSAPEGDGEVDLSLLALPVVILGVGGAVALLVVERIMREAGRRPSALAPVVFLAWRRATRASGTSRAVVAALAVSFGLFGLSTLMVDELDDAVSASLFVELGGETLVDLVGLPADDLELPPMSSIVGFEQTRIAPGSQRVRVVAVDLSTAADSFDWPDDAELSFVDFAELLEADVGGDLPVVSLTGQSVPRTGSFGVAEPVPYTVVGSVGSIPLASDSRVTLAVSRARFDRFVLERTASAVGVSPEDPDFVESFVPPSSRLRQHLISQSSRPSMEIFLADNDVRHRSVISRADRRADADLIAPSFAFGYLRWLGAVGILAALASLLLYLSSQRATRELGSLMARRMGLSANRLALTTAAEVAGIATVALITSAALVPPLVRRTVPRFDPAPDLPPVLDPATPWTTISAACVIMLAAVGGTVWLAERVGRRRPDGVVLREQS